MYAYETPDGLLCDWGGGDAYYTRSDRLSFGLELDGSGNPSPYLACNFTQTELPLFSFSAADSYENFFNTGHETVIDFYIEDGLLHIVSVFDEEGTAGLAEYFLLENDAYVGHADFVADAESYEALYVLTRLEKDGEMICSETQAQEFNQPEPSLIQALQAPYLRESENMMTLRIYLNHGTEHEDSFVLTIPENMDFQFAADVNALLFDDPDYTTVSHWDRKTSRDFYLVTEYDDELLERFNALVEILQSE